MKLSFANVVSCIALFVALGGVGYAATQLPKNSVGPRQLRKGAVTPTKLSAKSKQALTGPPGPTGKTGATGLRGPEGKQGIQGNPGSAALLSSELKRDVTLRGKLDIDEQATKAEQISAQAISFGFSLAATPKVELISNTTTTNCPGNSEEPRAAPGYLCVYRLTEANLEPLSPTQPVGVIASPFGADVVAKSKNAGRFYYEAWWAVTGS